MPRKEIMVKPFRSNDMFENLDRDGWAARQPLRRDLIAMLDYLREETVIGTQSTGNFPLKHVKGITARFVDPPELAEKVGDKVYRIRSEDDLPYLVLLHQMASVIGLIDGGHGKRWKLHTASEQFTNCSAAQQLWGMFRVWWEQFDWCGAYPVEGLRDGLPRGFRKETLRLLRRLDTGSQTLFDPFAANLIRMTGMKWPIDDQDRGESICKGAIQAIVIKMLELFSVLETEFESIGHGISKLNSFKITEQGGLMLAGLFEDALPI